MERLINTLPCRNDLQVIVVDDCSTQKVEEYENLKLNFPNIEYYSTETNGGGGRARNIGLKYANGKYVLFADSDDFFMPSIDNLFNKYLNHDFDILFFNAISLDDETYHICNRSKQLNRFITNAVKNSFKGVKLLKYIFGEPWCKIIRRELIESNNISFDEIRIHNDTKFSYLCGFFARKCTVDDTIAYCVTDRIDSVSKAISKRNLEIRFGVFLEKNIFLRLNGINIFDPIIISPLKITLLNGNIKNFLYFITIMKRKSYPFSLVLYQYIKYKLKFIFN
ncbi:MAG: glycosyltransferase [Muribaculum sp.]|nr:glycosyltransferase [Muribaculum sp.]